MVPQRNATRALATTLVVALMALTGCSVGADPSPSPSETAAFASEEEAFAAAEEVYRAYIAALNNVDFSVPSTFEDVYALLSGDASTSTREAFSDFHAEEVTSSGTTSYLAFAGKSAAVDGKSVIAQACLDVSDVEVRAKDGTSLVSDTRPDLQAMTISFKIASAHTLLIDSMQPDSDYTCAA